MTRLVDVRFVNVDVAAPVPALTPPHAAAMARPTWGLATTPTDEAQSVSVSGDTVWDLTQDALFSLSEVVNLRASTLHTDIR